MAYMLVTVWAVLLEKLNLYFPTVSKVFVVEHAVNVIIILVVLEPVLSTTEATEYLQKNVNPVLLKGLTQLCKEKPVDPIVSHHKRLGTHLL